MASGLSFKSDLTKLQKVIRENPQKIGAGLDATAHQMTVEIQLSFPPQSPSPAGGPPGVDTNHLRPSIRWEPDGKYSRIIEDGVEYGVYQEFGTDHSLPPRPFMTPMFHRWESKLELFLSKFLATP